MKAAILITFFVFFVCSSAFQFKQKDGQYEQRFLHVGRWSGPFGLFSGAWFRSLQIEASKPNLEGDYLWGSVYIGLGFFPVSWVGYYTADINRNINQSIANDTDLSSYNVSTTSSFIASSYLLLQERTPQGEAIDELPIKNFIWTYSPQRSDELSNSSLGIYAFVVQGRHLLRTVTMEIQFIVTQQGGLLDNPGDTLVIPKAVESIIIIDKWTYSNPNNSLRLSTAVGTSTTSWSNDGSILSGSGSGQVFFHLASEAFCDGELQKIQLTRDVKQDLSLLQNPSLQAQLLSRFGTETSLELIWVTFPPNASYIEYDPLMGAGESPYDPETTSPENNNAVVIGVSVGVVLVVIVIIVVVVVVYKRKRSGYDTVVK